MSILLRIASNYFQMLAITMSFSFKWPDFVTSAKENASTVGNTSEMLISYDCLLNETRINFFGLSDFILKTFVSTMLPFCVLFFGFSFSVLCKLFLWKRLNMI